VDTLPVLLFVGRLAPRKGPDVMLRAFALLEERGVRVRLRMIGDGPMEERCRAMVPSSARDRVELLGRVGGDELARHYRSATIYVAPSVGGESFGVVLIEAMSAGCPVVASNLPGYASVVADGVTGVLSPVGDAVALADRLEALLADEEQRRRLVAAAGDDVRQYDWPVVAGRVREIYERVYARSP
jgi:phosphatidylinositol alpha-mannosyltransferase